MSVDGKTNDKREERRELVELLILRQWIFSAWFVLLWYAFGLYTIAMIFLKEEEL